MSQLSNKLTAKAAKNLSYNPKGKNKYADGGGLYLLITANGSKHWRMDYRRPVTQKRNTLALLLIHLSAWKWQGYGVMMPKRC